MRTFAKGLLFSVLAGSLMLGAGCGGKKAKCEKAFDHMMGLMEKSGMMDKEEMEKAKKDKTEDIKKCEKEADEKALDCIIAAKAMEDVMKCDLGKLGK